MASQDTQVTKLFGERYREHEEALSKNYELVSAGDLGRELGPSYMKQLEDMIDKHSRLKGIYYIFVLHHQNMMFPNAQYLTFCSARDPFPGYPGADLWKVNNENCNKELVWTLPHSEMWDRVKTDITTPIALLNYMQQFEQGKL